MVYAMVALTSALRAMRKIAPRKVELEAYGRFYLSIKNGTSIHESIMEAKTSRANFNKVARMIDVFIRYADVRDIRFTAYADVLTLGDVPVWPMTETETGYALNDDVYITKAYQRGMDTDVYINEALNVLLHGSDRHRLSDKFPNAFPEMRRLVAFGDVIHPPIDDDPLYLGEYALVGGLGPFPFVFYRDVHTMAHPPDIPSILLRTATVAEQTVNDGISFAFTIITPDRPDAEYNTILDGIEGVVVTLHASEEYEMDLFDPSKDEPIVVKPNRAIRVYRYSRA